MECVQFRMSGRFVATVFLSPGPRQKWKNVHVLLYPFVRELLELMNGFRVYDGHFKKYHEQMFVYLSVVHCDTVARNDLGCFAPVSARRNDARSLWEGTSGINGHGMYSKGYLEPISQTWMGDELVYANDERAMLSHEDHLHLVDAVVNGGHTPMACGRYSSGPLEQLPYFDPIWAYCVPFGHSFCYGISKLFFKMLLGKVDHCEKYECVFSTEALSRIQARGVGLQPPSDMARGYHDIVQYLGMPSCGHPFLKPPKFVFTETILE